MSVSRFFYRLVLVFLMVILFTLPACSTTEVKETETPLPAVEETSTAIPVEEEQTTEVETAVPEAEEAAVEEITPIDLDGRWEGTILVAGSTLPMEVVFNSEEEELQAFLDISVQGLTDYPLSEVSYEDGLIHFEGFSEAGSLAVWEGEAQPDGTISGVFTQSGYEGSFSLAPKVEEAAEPLPYLAEEVEFQNGDLTFAGTLTLPEGEGPFPAFVLISGSGAQDRDENIYGFKIFGILADMLTRNGIAVLRYDDRGVGGSDGSVAEATSEDLAGDVLAAVDYLKSRSEIDLDQIGLLGHSEGGYIAPMVAARSEDVSMIVLLSGPAMPGEEVIYDQLELISRAEGLSEEEISQSLEDQQAVFEALFAGGEVWENYKPEMRQRIADQLEALPDAQKEALGDLDAYAERVYQSQISQLESAWYQFFLTYDPAVDLEKVSVPVLAFYGGLDLQVPAEENKALLEKALARGGNTQVTTIVIPEANHLYQKAVTGSSSEYASLEFEFVPGFLDQLLAWVQEQTGKSE